MATPPQPLDVVKLLRAYNAGRDPERLALKYLAMRRNDFAFMRGSNPLFCQRLPRGGIFSSAPPAWICGDLHLENFGSYSGDNGLGYFDLNDFDEAALAPLSWELLRLLSSVHLAAMADADTDGSQALSELLLGSYANALAAGKPYWLDRRDRAETLGPVGELLDGLASRSASAFLDSRTVGTGKRRRLRVDGQRALPADTAHRDVVSNFMADFARQQSDPDFYEVIDVARRVAGLASLGLPRDVVLVRGTAKKKSSDDGNVLLDLKAAAPSALLPRLGKKIAQPRWPTQAHRVVAVQRRLQAVPMAFLRPVLVDGQASVLRGLQPAEDRVALNRLKPRTARALVQTLGQLAAWAHLRGAAQQGSAGIDVLADFGRRKKWRKKLLEAATETAAQQRKDAQTYNQAYDDGAFKP